MAVFTKIGRLTGVADLPPTGRGLIGCVGWLGRRAQVSMTRFRICGRGACIAEVGHLAMAFLKCVFSAREALASQASVLCTCSMSWLRPQGLVISL